MTEGVDAGGRGSGRPEQRWTQNIEDILGMRVHEVERPATSRESLGQAVKRVSFPKGSVTRRRHRETATYARKVPMKLVLQ